MAFLVLSSACRSGIDLSDPLDTLPESGTFAFFQGDTRWDNAEQLLERAVDSCGWTRSHGNDADLVLRWEPQLVKICLDYWDVSCEFQEATISVTTSVARTVWRETLPGWCGARDCLVKLFVRDLKNGLCADVPPNHAGTADVIRRFAPGAAADPQGR